MLAGCKSSQVAKPATIPSAPQYYVLDESKVLNSRALKSLESLLIEHDRLTGEEFLIGIFKQLGNADVKARTHQIFQKWFQGKRGQENGILLAIFVKEQISKIETGYGLSSIITEDKIKELSRSIRIINSENNLGETILHILETLNSPLIQSGKAEELLQYSGLLTSSQSQDLPSSEIIFPQKGWGALFLLGVVAFFVTLTHLLSREAHFTRTGWYRPSLWALIKHFRKLRHSKNNELGGASGSW